MKRTYFILAAACLMLGSTACSSKTAETAAVETTTAAETEEEKETTEETKADKESEKETQETEEETTAETKKEVVKEAVTGRVTKIEKQMITINGQDDLEYRFDLTDAETRSNLEMGEGDEVQVVFVKEDDEEVYKAESYDILTSMSMVGDMDPVITGVIKNSSSDSVTIEVASGKEYRFSTAIAQMVVGDKGLAAGEYVEITYMGNLDAQKALRVITEEASGDAEATYKAIIGNLVQATETSLTIAAADGNQLTFPLEENVYVLDFEAGETLEVVYEGSLTNKNAVAVSADYR